MQERKDIAEIKTVGLKEEDINWLLDQLQKLVAYTCVSSNRINDEAKWAVSLQVRSAEIFLNSGAPEEKFYNILRMVHNEWQYQALQHVGLFNENSPGNQMLKHLNDSYQRIEVATEKLVRKSYVPIIKESVENVKEEIEINNLKKMVADKNIKQDTQKKAAEKQKEAAEIRLDQAATDIEKLIKKIIKFKIQQQPLPYPYARGLATLLTHVHDFLPAVSLTKTSEDGRSELIHLPDQFEAMPSYREQHRAEQQVDNNLFRSEGGRP